MIKNADSITGCCNREQRQWSFQLFYGLYGGTNEKEKIDFGDFRLSLD